MLGGIARKVWSCLPFEAPNGWLAQQLSIGQNGRAHQGTVLQKDPQGWGDRVLCGDSSPGLGWWVMLIIIVISDSPSLPIGVSQPWFMVWYALVQLWLICINVVIDKWWIRRLGVLLSFHELRSSNDWVAQVGEVCGAHHLRGSRMTRRGKFAFSNSCFLA